MAGLPSQILISARAKFQAEVWPASSGKAIDGVLMMSGLTDKRRVGPGQAAEGRLSTLMGTRHLSPWGLEEKMRGQDGAWGFSPCSSHRLKSARQADQMVLSPQGAQGGPGGQRCPEPPPTWDLVGRLPYDSESSVGL